VEGTLLALSCFATWLYAGWTLGFWRPGLPLTSMPASPPGLRLGESSPAYLQTLTAYFFPTITAQIANVLAKRSWTRSLFARDFLDPGRRAEILSRLSRAARGRIGAWIGGRLARLFGRHPRLLNVVSNPLVDLGIGFELALCAAFFYTPLARLYAFAPVPWHVYLFAFHGTVLLLAFTEARKALARRRATPSATPPPRAQAPACRARR
jgi:hypothetical protein